MSHHDSRNGWLNDVDRTRLSRRGLVKGAAIGGAGLAAAGQLGNRAAFAQTPTPAQVDPTADEPEVQLPLTEEKQTLGVFMPQDMDIEDYETNAFTLWLEEQTNVHIEWQTAAPDDSNAALTLRLASGDYPDILMDFRPQPSVLQLYGSQGIFQPLNDLIEQHAPVTKAHWEAYPAARQASTAADGNIYSLPQINDCYHCSMAAKLWINRDWLETLGLEMPQTTEEYADVLRAFKNEDPNGNGEADEIPLSGSSRIWHGNPDEYFMGAFIYHPGNRLRLINDGGQVVPIYAQEAWREGIRYLAGLHAEGLLATDIFTNDSDGIRALAASGADGAAIVGSVPAGATDSFIQVTTSGDDLWYSYTANPPLEGPDGVRFSMHDPFWSAGIGALVITDKCENPELAMKWADFLGKFEPTTRSIHGIKDTDWRFAYEGEVGIDGEQALWHSITDLYALPTENITWSESGPSYRSNAYRLGKAVDPATIDTNWEKFLYEVTKNNYAPYAPEDTRNLPPIYFTVEQAEQMATILPQLQTYVDETFAQAVTGEIDIDAAWEDYLANLDAIGLQTAVDMHQEQLEGALS